MDHYSLEDELAPSYILEDTEVPTHWMDAMDHDDHDEDVYYGPDGEYDEDMDDMDIEYEAEYMEADGISDSELADLQLDAETNTSQSLQGMASQSQPAIRNTDNDASAHTDATIDILRRLMGRNPALRNTVIQGLGNSGIRLASLDENEDEEVEEEEEEEEEEETYFIRRWAPPQSPGKFFDKVVEPVKAGKQLLKSGEFGSVGISVKKEKAIKRPLPRLVRDREASFGRRNREDIGRTYVPNSNGTVVANYGANVYSGQFSADSSFFFTCCQDFRLHVYDTTTPPIPFVPTAAREQPRRNYYLDESDDHQTTMKTVKTMRGYPGSWTITDVDLSPDNERMIYSSITSTIYMAKTRDGNEEQIPLYFHDRAPDGGRRPRWEDDGEFGIWSCRFSADGNEIVAGAGNRADGLLFVYDLQAQKRVLKITAHDDDVNSCCWADTASGNVLISGSDDAFVKVWDRRSLSGGKPSGVLIGHTEGITNVAPKGDGRYVISNGKDQALRLWDLRKMCSSEEFDSVRSRSYGIPNWDYRSGAYTKPRHLKHPKDCSVMTYRGHAVLRTLIRCHFSPAATTGGSYLYSGSADGKIHIWSLDGRIVQVLDRAQALPISYDASAAQPPAAKKRPQGAGIVRDVSWHTSEPVLLSSAWAGSRGRSSVARHEWKELGKNGLSLEDVVEREALEGAEASERRMPGSFRMRSGDDDD